MAIPSDDGAAAAGHGDLRQGMLRWRRRHPEATLREIEEEADRHLSGLRAELVVATAQAELGETRPVCPTCGRAMQRVGRRTRRVTTTQNAALTLHGPGYRCSVCGTGLFPPGGDARFGG